MTGVQCGFLQVCADCFCCVAGLPSYRSLPSLHIVDVSGVNGRKNDRKQKITSNIRKRMQIQFPVRGPGRVDDDMDKDTDDFPFTVNSWRLCVRGDATLPHSPWRHVSELLCRSATNGKGLPTEQEMV